MTANQAKALDKIEAWDTDKWKALPLKVNADNNSVVVGGPARLMNPNGDIVIVYSDGNMELKRGK